MKDIWGKIVIEKEFENIIKTREYGDLKNKTQLGLNSSPNATHTRYQHSLGVYYLACKLIDICKRKFSHILNITSDDENAVKLMALVHDIGHGCFSHVSEKYLEGSHEERTVAILKDEDSEIHKAIIETFGENVLNRLLEFIEMKEKIKNQKEFEESNSLMLIIGKLLSGGIDIDRIDYIFRDSKNVLGELNDFSEILESIDLEFIDNSLEVVFDGKAEYAIANFFNKRFELYDTVYCSNETRILECIFHEFLRLTGVKLDWNTSEIEMDNLFREYSSNSDPVIRRYARILQTRQIDDGILFKEINDKGSFEFFKSKVRNAVLELADYDDCVFLDSCVIDIYNKKNKIYIKKNGLIQDLSECSKILNSNLHKEKHIYGVDLVVLEERLRRDGKTQEQIDKIIKKVKKVMSPEIEQEKKYTFNENSSDPKEDFKKIKESLELGGAKFIENLDVYFDNEGILETRKINLRRRGNGAEVEWTIKRPVKDYTSISKRDEKNFSSMEEALLFLKTEWGIDIDHVEEDITLKTKRAKYTLECYGGVFEVVFDRTVPCYGGVDYPEFYMIECELKEGNSSGLYFIDKKIREFRFVDECNKSKREIAKEIVKRMLATNEKRFFMKPVEGEKK